MAMKKLSVAIFDGSNKYIDWAPWLLCHYVFYCFFSQSQILFGKVQARRHIGVSTNPMRVDSFIMWTPFSLPINLHDCWPCVHEKLS